MKLDQPYSFVRAGKANRQCPCYVRLTSSRWPLKDYLMFILKEHGDVGQEITREQ